MDGVTLLSNSTGDNKIVHIDKFHNESYIFYTKQHHFLFSPTLYKSGNTKIVVFLRSFEKYNTVCAISFDYSI